MIKIKLEYIVSPDKAEGTAKPVWYVVKTGRQKLVHKHDFCYEIMRRIIGPFTSRENAEKHRQSRIYEYGKDSVVFCHSGYYSDLIREECK